MLTDFCKPMIGGLEQHVFSLSKKLVENGHQVIIGTVKQKGMKLLETYDEIYIHRLESLFQKVPLVYLDPTKKYHPPFQDVLLARELEKLVKNFQPNLIHCHGWIAFSYLPLKSKFNTPIISTLHHYGFLCPKQDLFFENGSICKQPFTSACYQCCAKHYGVFRSTFMVNLVKMGKRHFSKIDEIIAVSNFVKNVHTRYLKLPNNRIVTIPNFYEAKNEHTLDCGDLPPDFILYVGQLAPHKGIDLLLTAYKLSEIDLPLVLLGSKHHAHSYKRFDDGAKIIVKENASRSLVLSALKNCRFVVVPSIWPEPAGTSILEAMSFSKAVLASKSGGIPEIVNQGETGHLLNPRKIREFAEHLKLLANNPHLCEKMGNKGRIRFLRYFTAERAAKDTENLYNRILEKKTINSQIR